MGNRSFSPGDPNDAKRLRWEYEGYVQQSMRHGRVDVPIMSYGEWLERETAYEVDPIEDDYR